MTPQQFIEKAIEGGYRGKSVYHNPTTDTWHSNELYQYEIIILDPLAWQAVGKVRPNTAEGSGHIVLRSPVGYALDKDIDWVEYSMHRMIDALIEGKTIEQFLETL